MQSNIKREMSDDDHDFDELIMDKALTAVYGNEVWEAVLVEEVENESNELVKLIVKQYLKSNEMYFKIHVPIQIHGIIINYSNISGIAEKMHWDYFVTNSLYP